MMRGSIYCPILAHEKSAVADRSRHHWMWVINGTQMEWTVLAEKSMEYIGVLSDDRIV